MWWYAKSISPQTLFGKENTLNGWKVYEDQEAHHTNNNNVNHVQSNNGLCVSIFKGDGGTTKGGVYNRD